MSAHPLWRPLEKPSVEAMDQATVWGSRPRVASRRIEVVAPDPTWPAQYGRLAGIVRNALGDRVIALEHIGSTSVPGLYAKPVIDLVLTVADSSDEAGYVAALDAAGFRLTIREPDWEQHRCFNRDDIRCNLHVFSPGAVEPRRLVAFRDWLHTHDDDRAEYARLKRELSTREFDSVMEYNNEKAQLIYDIYERIFTADIAGEFNDPRLVALYDTVSAGRDDFEFFLALADELGARRIVDIGCGTGVLACEFAARGLDVIGVDPAPEMLAIARDRPGGENVRWIAGEATALDVTDADLVVMTAHVAQSIAADDAWAATVAAARTALRDGGRLAFDSRDPRAQAWLDWTPQRSRRGFPGGDVWYSVERVEGELIDYTVHYLLDGDQHLQSHGTLRFRTEAELTESLAGFAVEHIYGDFDRRPVGGGTPELIYVSTASGRR